MNSIISYKKDISIAKRFFGIVFTCLGLVMILSTGNFIALILIVIGLGLNVAEGSEIDLSTMQFRTFNDLFGIKIGSWKPIPNFEYISVFKTRESQTVRVLTAETTNSYDIILINLFYDRNKNITFYKTTNKEDAFKVADHFRLVLNIDVLDATGHERKWL
jgi:hypothetical protein